MEKRLLISEIVPKLDQMGIVYTLGQGTDIAIECEFLDAGWGIGNKKIQYTSRVYFDESANTVTMWELTKEIGSGLSFGGDSETSFQSGATLFRKVKSVHYGPDGKAYEYNLNLGAIPKAFKETAKAHGWKFKTVLRPNKACFPPGYTVPAGANQQQAGFTSGQPVENNPQQENISTIPPPFQQYQPSTESTQAGNAVAPQPQVSGENNRKSHMPEQKYSDPNSTFYARGCKNKDGIKGIFF
ncbi:MAG TPA: hypothetical protein VHP38_05330, partial [Ruminiclostridium sp.]|nr:hypothetical protein [Ruminiclostridium sp.]